MKICRLPKSVLILVAISAIWVFVGEIGIFYVHSLKWQWPQLGLSSEQLKRDFNQLSPHQAPQGPIATGNHYHYQSGDSHYYTTEHSDQHGDGEKEKSDVGLHVLIMSDPHIMCTFQ